LVIHLHGPDSFNIDTCDCFGLRPATGIHGKFGDTGAELMQAHGIGLVSKWSDNHSFSAYSAIKSQIITYNTISRV
jgi:hypothetical protein